MEMVVVDTTERLEGMQELERWVVDINERLERMQDTSEEIELWRKRSIYMLPSRVTDLDNKAYKPQVVSLGPYHNGLQHLLPMEEHKNRAFLHFLKRSNATLQSYLHALEEVVQDLEEAYDQLDTKWLRNKDRFLKLMVLDGCFILETLRLYSDQEFDDYAPNDPIFSNHGKLYMLPFLRRDMLLLENQVPSLVLIKLLQIGNITSQPHDYVTKLITRFFDLDRYGQRVRDSSHLLDVVRESLIRDVYRDPKRTRFSKRTRFRYHHEDDDGIIPSATQLREAGIRIKRSRITSLIDISLRRNTLRLPAIVVHSETKSRLLNLIAFERFHVGAGNEVTSYINLMASLINSSKYVALLCSCGVISNALGTDEDVAKLFNLLSTDVTFNPESSVDTVYRMVRAKLRNRFRKRLHEWQSDLVQTYFRSPWAAVSVVAAFLLFTLTIIQTVYAVFSSAFHPYDYSNCVRCFELQSPKVTWFGVLLVSSILFISFLNL